MTTSLYWLIGFEGSRGAGRLIRIVGTAARVNCQVLHGASELQQSPLQSDTVVLKHLEPELLPLLQSRSIVGAREALALPFHLLCRPAMDVHPKPLAEPADRRTIGTIDPDRAAVLGDYDLEALLRRRLVS